jgi:C-terminal processing protease CtpA/Prc
MLPVPAPRMCNIIKRDNFDGYGFNLYKKKNTPGQFIGSIDQGSPAEAAGLKEGDKLVEVNGINVTEENHKQVVQRIREISTEVTILVVDNTCDEYHKEKKIKITNLLPNVLRISSKKEQKTSDKNYETLDKNLQGLSIIGEQAKDASEATEVCDEHMETLESSLSSSEKVCAIIV